VESYSPRIGFAGVAGRILHAAHSPGPDRRRPASRPVINWVERLLRAEAPDRVENFLGRLDEAEYRAQQEKHGTVRALDRV
jgi:hypothetical protein